MDINEPIIAATLTQLPDREMENDKGKPLPAHIKSQQSPANSSTKLW